MSRLKDKIAFISGAAGSIGAATARRFVAEGARVVVSDVDAGGLYALVDELGAGAAVAAVADVTDSAQVGRAVALAVERFGGLDVAFANAGIFGEVAEVADYPEAVFERVLAVNVRGPFHVAKHALKAMRPGGSLILNSSVVGLTSDPGICAYATSKHALVGLMRTAAKEVAGRGIRVNSIHPGPVDNDFQHRIETIATGEAEDRAAAFFEAMIPLGRHATPKEVAAAVLFLASDESAFMTGATIPLDGGMSI
ncbi:MAG: SDR family oxidoreductase [Actinomycetota bacterium]|nr:SDR family oxidoreductase [Actinomycetota bacterium]